jgi:hypothetical protein
MQKKEFQSSPDTIFKNQFSKINSKWILARCRWLTPVILATQEAEIRRFAVPSQPRQIVLQTLSQKYPT